MQRGREIHKPPVSFLFIYIFLLKSKRFADSDKALRNYASVCVNADCIRANQRFIREKGLHGSWQHVRTPERIMEETLRNQYL